MAFTFNNVSETGNFNVARHYSESIIMDSIYNIHTYEKICKFGIEELYEDLVFNNNSLRNKARVNALNRYLETLISLIDETKFAVRFKYKEKMDEIYTKLYQRRKDFHLTHELVKKQYTTVYQIDERVYNAFLQFLCKVKGELLEYLNKSDLIFHGTEFKDPRQVKLAIKDRLMTQG